MQNPFNTTFSKLPENTYISTASVEDIIVNFSYDNPTEGVYKITGLRGSGKTVMLSYVQKKYTSEENKEKGWIVYTLNPSRDMLSQLASLLYNEEFIPKSTKGKSINMSATVMGTGGSFGYSQNIDDRFFDAGVEIKKMLEIAQEKNKKILICVDEISKTPDMVVFLLEFAGWIIQGFPVYLVCTGLYENVLELGNTKNITFFRRGKTIPTSPLNYVKMAEMYKNKLNISIDIAKKMAEITKGYAYAFQELGSLYFNKTQNQSLDEIVELLKSELFSYSYEKIWEELSGEDKYLTKLLTDKEEYKREEVLQKMGDKKKNYSVYRDRLIKRGVITARQGYIGLYPPFFAEYMKEYW